MSISRTILAGALTTALAASTAHAGGIALNDFGARASGRGTAMVAETNDPSAIYFNPANMAFLPGLTIDVTLGAVMPKYTWESLDGSQTASTTTTVVPIPALSAVYNLGNVGNIGDLAVGLGFYVPMGSGFEWPNDWAGFQQIRKIQLNVFELAPAVAWRPLPWMSVGAGFRWLPSQVYLSRGLQFGSEAQGSVQMRGSGNAFGWNAGVTLAPIDMVTLGFSYRSGPTLDLSGDARFDFPAPFDTAVPGDKVEASIGTAAFYRAGVEFKPLGDALALAFDLERATWSNLKSLDITFIAPDGTRTTENELRNSDDSWTFHFGGEYRLSQQWAVRAGYIYDQATLPEQTVNPAPPDSNVNLISLGASYYLGEVGGIQDFGIHAYFEDAIFAKRTVRDNTFPGVYTGAYAGGTYAYLFGLGVGGSFGTSGTSKFAAPAASAQ